MITAGTLQSDAAAPRMVNAMQAVLQQQEDRRSIDGPTQSAHLVSAAGVIQLRDTNSVTGTAQRPGKAEFGSFQKR